MPTASIGPLVRAALHAACNDRLSLAEAYGCQSEMGMAALAMAAQVAALRGVEFRAMSDAQLETARLALLYAEQWELSLADSFGEGPGARKARAAGLRYRKARVARFGLTKVEAEIASAKPVDITEIVRRARSGELAVTAPAATAQG